MSVISQVNVQNMTIQKSDLPSMTISFKGDITAHASTTTTTTVNGCCIFHLYLYKM